MPRASIHEMTSSPSSSIQGHTSDVPIQLGTDLWFDAATATIFRQEQAVPLTARETAVLTLLLTLPGRFHGARTLARLLQKQHAFPITSHSIEQTIYGLRRKLGESGQEPRLLRSRRGLGYGLFMPIGPATPNSSIGAPMQGPREALEGTHA